VKPTSPVGEDGDDAKDNDSVNIPDKTIDLTDENDTSTADKDDGTIKNDIDNQNGQMNPTKPVDEKDYV
jgi:hypothetical protein